MPTAKRTPKATSTAAKVRNVNFDEIHAARLEEAGGTGPTVTIGGAQYELPVSLPAIVIVGLARLNRDETEGFDDVMDSLFGDDAPTILKAGLAVEDLEHLVTLYDDPEGETAPK